MARAQRQYENQEPPGSDDVDCPDCEGEGKVMESNCCGAAMDEDTGICLDCHDHCEPAKCETCDGTGKVGRPSKREMAELKAEYLAERKQDDAFPEEPAKDWSE